MTAVPQHEAARKTANEVRLAVADLKRHVRCLPPGAGATRLAEVIEANIPEYGSARMLPLLTAVRYIGADKALRCLHKAGVQIADRRLRELTDRQRVAVAFQLRVWAAGFER